MNKSILEKQIKGGLKSSIIAHGPISLNKIGSATKRISGNLLAAAQIKQDEQEFKVNITNFLDFYHAHLLKYRQILKYCKNERNCLTLRAKNKILGIILQDLRRMVFDKEIPEKIEKYLKFEDGRKS